jgi:hypothetical protein
LEKILEGDEGDEGDDGPGPEDDGKGENGGIEGGRGLLNSLRARVWAHNAHGHMGAYIY